MSFLPGLPGPHQLFDSGDSWGKKNLKVHGFIYPGELSHKAGEYLGLENPFSLDIPTLENQPQIDSAEVQAAADAERRRQRRSKGRGATMLTSAAGVTSSAPIGTATLLGG